MALGAESSRILQMVIRELLLAAIRKTTNLSIRFVVNMHCHLAPVARGRLGLWSGIPWTQRPKVRTGGG